MESTSGLAAIFSLISSGRAGQFRPRTMGHVPLCRGRCKFRNAGSLATCSWCIPAVFSRHPNSTGPFESCWLVGFRLDAVSLYRFILHLSAPLCLANLHETSWLLPSSLSLSLSLSSRCCPPYKPQITNAYAIQPFFAPRSHGSSSRGS